jgi:hypothetical protein
MGFSFDHLPFNTLIGADSTTFAHATEHFKAEGGYRQRYLLTRLCNKALRPLYRTNQHQYLALPKPEIISPVFIIGHWRSGTTYLHNLLCGDHQFGYCTTYQTVFPHLMLYGSGLFKRLARLCMPASRPADHLALSVNQPQEEEFALSNMTHAAFYHFWIFPRRFDYYRDRYLFFDTATDAEVAEFRNALRTLIHICLHCQGKSRFLSKNPPHIARIPLLLSMFPDAKFIYIHRREQDVIRSTKNFFRQTLSALTLQNFSENELDCQIVNTYHALIDRYKKDRSLIDKSNLCEISFEDLIADKDSTLDYIYSRL